MVNGVSGDISIIIGEEKFGFGLTINQMETVDKFDHTYFIEIFLDKLFFYYFKFYLFVPKILKIDFLGVNNLISLIK